MTCRFELDKVYAAAGLQPTDKLLVTNVGYLENAAKLFDDGQEVCPGDGMWTDPESRVSIW